MKILGYIVPKSMQDLSFIKSLHKQMETKGKLSMKQIWALEDILGVELDFYSSEFEPDPKDEHICREWDNLISKYKRNRFRSHKTRNKCIRAMESIVDQEPLQWLIDDALGRINLYFNPYRRW